ncbi:DNA-processing protein DprA [Amycolatopsis sp. NPDC021455]|uniref:DNA-processing protein DprA n=1 Tax=Amycolatopsis sp. NPDC021455 TaxID=3154901 RepID=UPI0033EE054C
MTIEGATSVRELVFALLAPRAAGGPRRAAKVLLQSGRRSLEEVAGELPYEEQVAAAELADGLLSQGVGVLFCDDPAYPDRLRVAPGAPPVLYHRGPIELLNRSSIGVCGSRNAGTEGLRAARACGEEAAALGVVVVSGYAKGVDTEAHTAALTAGGGTVAVLAEGILDFRLKQAYRDLPDEALRRLLVVSQFPPKQRWTAGAAMTRNQVIVGLGDAVVAVEAGKTGGTLRAGEVALQSGKRLWVLGFPGEDPPGNKALLAAGGSRIASRTALRAKLQDLLRGPFSPSLFD